MTRDELQKIMDAPGFGTGRAFRDQKAQENDAIALLPDRAWMKPVMAAPNVADGWLVCSFGNIGDDGQDWYLVTDNVRASGMASAIFPDDAKTDAHAIAAVMNAWRMGLIVLRADLVKQ